MATVPVYDQKKQQSGEIVLPPEVFEIEARPEILNFVVRAQMAANRSGTHSVKTRGMVSGGGVKPWKQKGTGRARAGSSRSPIWRGGAIIFGPTPRKYGFKVNRKIRHLALRMALSNRLAENDLMVVNKIELAEPKTKLFAAVAKDLGLEKALIILPERDHNLLRASNNCPGIIMTTPEQISVLEVLNHKQLVIMQDAVEKVVRRFEEKEERK